MRIKVFLILIAALAAALGCSSGMGPTTPETTQPRLTESGHQIVGLVDFTWDGVSDTFTAVPNRILDPHWDVTGTIVPYHIKLKIVGWDAVNKIITAQADITNPTLLTGHDIRGILINLGDKKLVNPEDYTKLFDSNIPKVANPFRAFAKDQPARVFNPSSTHSEIYEIYFPAEIFVSFVISAAWPSNADEPYDIVSIGKTGHIYETEGSIDVTVEVLDWQDVTAADVVIESNPVTGGDVHMTKIDDTHWSATIENTGGAAQGSYEAWVAAYDGVVSYPLYNKFTINIEPPVSNEWGPPIIIDDEAGVDKILPRVILRETDYWVIYTNGTNVKAKKSTDYGLTWSAAMTVGTYADVDTLHAVLGGDNLIYVQYQRSDTKNTYVTKYDGSTWLPAANPNYMGMTVPPYSCDLGIGADGHIFDMLAGDWSTFGFRSDNPYDITAWSNDPIESFYHGIYSSNDGFVQQAAMAKFFFVHEHTQLDYAWYDAGWDKAAAMTGTEELIEPAIAPESDGPYHGVIARYDGADYDVEYFRYDSWPPGSASTVVLATGLADIPTFHSVSVEDADVSILYDADGEIRYVESANGGDSFSADEILGGGGGSGGCAYSHVRRDPYSAKVVAAYALEESGDWNVYIRVKN